MLPLSDALTSAPPERWLEAGMKALAYLGLLYAAGALFFLTLLREVDTAIFRRSAVRAIAWALVAIAATALLFPIRAAFLGGSWEMAQDPMMLELVAASPLGTSFGLRAGGAAALCIGAALVLFGLRIGLFVGALGGTVALAGLTTIGHSAMLATTFLWQAALFAHLVVAAFWIGALAPLHDVGRCMKPEAAFPIMERFGNVAALAVGVLAAAGALIGWALLGGDIVGALGTAYGATLIAKLGLVALLLLIAATHKWRLVPASRSGGAASDHLARSIGRERWIAACIVVMTAVLTTLVGAPGGV